MTAAVDKQSLDHFFIEIQSASSLDTQNDGLSAVKERQIFAHRVSREAESLADLERALPAFMQELNVFQRFRSNHLGFPLLEETPILPVSTFSYRHVL